MSQASIFIAYAHQDEHLKEALVKHLDPLRRSGKAQSWHDRKIEPGAVWEHDIDAHLNSAQIILLLVSADFIASDYCYSIEMKRALERHESGEACVIPVILRSCDWHLLALSKLQAVPKDGKPITLWNNQDEALTDAVRQIRVRVERFCVTPEANTIPSALPAPSAETADVCRGCSTVNPDRCRSCKQCLTCSGEGRSWLRKAIFADGYYCSACSPSSDGSNIACS